MVLSSSCHQRCRAPALASLRKQRMASPARTSGDHSAVAPPVPIPNTEVKRCSPDGSATIGCARVGRRQNKKPAGYYSAGFLHFEILLEQRTRRAGKPAGRRKPEGQASGNERGNEGAGQRRYRREARRVSERERTNQQDVARTKCPVSLSQRAFCFPGRSRCFIDEGP